VTIYHDDDLSFELTIWDCETGKEVDMDADTCFRILYEAFARPYQPKAAPLRTKPLDSESKQVHN
jgi:hypothetical protein